DRGTRWRGIPRSDRSSRADYSQFAAEARKRSRGMTAHLTQPINLARPGSLSAMYALLLITPVGCTSGSRVAFSPVDEAGKSEPLKLSARWQSGDSIAPVALLVHGLGSSGTEFGDFAERLHALGIGTLIPDLRGHGVSKGAFPHQ